ncbi:MAG: T9SS type A sorting domain-containing protein [Bacteroidota bacterium]
MRFVSLLLLGLFAPAALAADGAETVKKISPVVECIGQQPDGTYFAWYGYYNRNSVTVSTPTGSGPGYANTFKGGADLGQPTEFLPGRQRHVFRIEYNAAPGSHGNTWILKAQGSNRQATATAGTNASPNCIYDRSGADLSMTASVSDPAPEVGETVQAMVVVRNDGPGEASGVVVSASDVPASVTIVGGSSTRGSVSGTTWTVGTLAAGASDTLWVDVRIDAEDAAAVAFEVTASSASDPDSTPGNGADGEDDQATAAVTPAASSGGNDGGLESDGSLATLLGRRTVDRMLARSEAARLGVAPAPLVRLADLPAARTMRGRALDLQTLLPADGPAGATGFQTTPEDLLQITNATALLAADYLQPDGDRVAVAFAALTPAGETYDHTKAICDRVMGSRLESVRLVEVDGAEFVLLHVTRPDGRVDYAISFVAYPEVGGGYALDSRFRAEEYAITPGQADGVLNVQAWGASPDAAAAVVAEILGALGDQVDLAPRNWGLTAPALPAVFVRGGEYASGALRLDVANTTGTAQTITFSGSTAPVEEGERTPFERTVTVPASGLETTLSLGSLFDVGFSVVPEAGAVADYVYLADGVWTYTSGDVADALDYAVEAGGAEPSFYVRPVERNARLAGTAASWAGLFRGIQPGSRPVDLTAYDALAFEARGEGRVQVVIEKTSTNGLEPFHAWIDLTDEAQTFEIPFADLRRGDGAAAFSAEDVTLLAFYTYNEGGAPAPFEMDVRDVRFLNARSVSTAPEAETAFALLVAPNPSRDAARVQFALPEAGDVTVEVVDLLGRRVATLADRPFSAGPHSLDLPRSLASGTYLVRLRAGRDALVQRITRLP